MDDEGYLYYHGRYDDLYKKNGFRISSIEVEKAATSISGVDMAALVPYTKHYGDVLFISGRNSESEVKEQLKRQLETHKIPNHVIKIGKFPLNENGKVDKKRLEAMYDHE